MSTPLFYSTFLRGDRVVARTPTPPTHDKYKTRISKQAKTSKIKESKCKALLTR